MALLLLTLRLGSGIATVDLAPVPGALVSLPSVASLADGSDATGGYVEAQGDGAPVAASWVADGVLDSASDAGLIIERVQVALRAKRQTVSGIAGSATIRPALDGVPVGAAVALTTAVQEFAIEVPGAWTATLINAARWGWRITADSGDGASSERGWILEYAVKVYGTRQETRRATVRAGERAA